MQDREIHLSEIFKESPVRICVGAFFSVVGVLVLTVFIIVGGAPWVDWQLDGSNGYRVLAQVEQIFHQANITVNGKHPFAILYTFQAQGQTYTGKSLTFDRRIVQSARQQRQTEIVYLQTNPRLNKIVGTYYSLFGAYCFIPLAAAFIGAQLLVGGIWAGWRRYTLLQRGTMTKGKVTELTVSPYYKTNGKPQLTIAYEFTTDTNERCQNKFQTYDHTKYGQVKAGDTVDVVYEVFFPEHNTLA